MFGLRDPKYQCPSQRLCPSDVSGGLPLRDSTYPDIEVEVLICHRFDVEADSRYCRHNFSNLRGRVTTVSENRLR